MNIPHIVLVGCGRWGQLILRDLLSLGCCVSVIARTEETRNKAKANGATESYTTLLQIPKDTIISGFIVATPTITHYEVIKSILEHFPQAKIFTEKCLCPNVEQARELVALSNNNVFVMDKWRYHPGIQSLAQIITSGELGKLIGIKTTRNGWGCPHTDVDSVWILLSHELSIVLELIKFIPSVVTAQADSVQGWAYGITATLGRTPWAILEVSSRSIKTVRQTRLIFEQGEALLDDSYATHIQIARNSEKHFPVSSPQIEQRAISTEMPLYLELKAFVDYLAYKAPAPRSSIQDAYTIVENITVLRKMAHL